MFLKIALKELKQFKRDKKNFAFNIVLPLFMILIISISTGLIYGKKDNKENEFTILTNSNYVKQNFKNDKNYSVQVINNVDNISNKIKKYKNDIGVLWNKDKKSVTFITNPDSDSNVDIIKNDVLKTIKLDIVSKNQDLNVKLKSINVKTNYGPITLKLTAAICAFLVLILGFRINNVNAFYLTTNEKSSGLLEVLLSTPIKEMDIILGKWFANFVSCIFLTLMILIPVYSVFILLFQVFLHSNVNLIGKLPLVIFEVILLCIVISILQLFLGFIAKNTKQAQMYLGYSPVILFIPLSILFGLDMKILYEYTLQNYIIDMIPILNFYDLIQISILGIVNVKKIIIIFFSNILFLFLILKKLVNIFKNEKILMFENK